MQDIRLNSDINNTNFTSFAITITSNPNYYCNPHLSFNAENSIYCRDIVKAGWTISKVSIRVYGIK